MIGRGGATPPLLAWAKAHGQRDNDALRAESNGGQLLQTGHYSAIWAHLDLDADDEQRGTIWT